MSLWKVAVEAPLMDALTYSSQNLVSTNLSSLARGASVRVPLGRRTVHGVVMGPGEPIADMQLKEIIELDHERPQLSDHYVKWLEWLSNYYLHPLGQVMELAFPPLPKNSTRKTRKSAVVPEVPHIEAPNLTDEQRATVDGILEDKGYKTHLVHGVTGSGKTEIYIQILEDVIRRGHQGIVLVPEISLTPQLVNRFVARLGDSVAVIHSHLTPREKTNQWWAMLEGQKQVLIGARSALFCPVKKLGVIIVDEEHEASFKQDEKLKYHARDAAVVLGKFSDCAVVLGSATPSLESWRNAQAGRYRLHSLRQRVENRALPTLEIVDLRAEKDAKKAEPTSDTPFWMSEHLHNALVETYGKKQQSALFLNRRGVAQTVFCPSCGYVAECPNCSVSLTLHGQTHLLCHYCDYHERLDTKCSDCREGHPQPLGLGTERVEEDLQKLFPSARVARMDRDEVTSREILETLIADIENQKVDFIVGTQMIAKGLDFPGLTLVGLVLADIGLNIPDFRSSERSFQLVTQVSGRSGRHLKDTAGRVIIQTYNPDHPSLLSACAHDYEGFAERELRFREQLGYPPVWRLASIRIQGLDWNKAQDTAHALKDRCGRLQKSQSAYKPIEILGPAQSPLARLRGQHRLQVLVKAPTADLLGKFCRALMHETSWIAPAVKVSIDIDALNLL